MLQFDLHRSVHRSRVLFKAGFYTVYRNQVEGAYGCRSASVIMDKHRRGSLTDRFVSVVDQLNRLMSGGNWVRLRILDLNVHHVNTLQVLNQNGPLRMSTIADHLAARSLTPRTL